MCVVKDLGMKKYSCNFKYSKTNRICGHIFAISCSALNIIPIGKSKGRKPKVKKELDRGN